MLFLARAARLKNASRGESSRVVKASHSLLYVRVKNRKVALRFFYPKSGTNFTHFDKSSVKVLKMVNIS